MESSLSLPLRTLQEATSVPTLMEESWDKGVRRQWRALHNPLVSAFSTSSLLVQGLPPVKTLLSNEFLFFFQCLYKIFMLFLKWEFKELWGFVQTSVVLFGVDFSFTFQQPQKCDLYDQSMNCSVEQISFMFVDIFHGTKSPLFPAWLWKISTSKSHGCNLYMQPYDKSHLPLPLPGISTQTPPMKAIFILQGKCNTEVKRRLSYSL